MIKIDKKDKKILEILDFNARASLSQISKKTGYSKQLVRYRMNELIRKNVIKGSYAFIDIFRIGYGSYNVFLKFQDITGKKEKDITNYLLKIKEIKKINSIGGNWDLVFVVWTKDLSELNNILEKISAKYGKYIFNKFVSISTNFYYFRNKFAYDAKDFLSISIKVQKDTIDLDKVDYKLINILNKDARISNVELARKLKLSPATVQKRINNLKSKEVIKGFRLMINENALNHFQYRLYLKLSSLHPERINELIRYLRHHKNAISVTKAIEKTYLEINLIVCNPKEFHNIINEIKYNFSDIFKDYVPYALYDI